ncbi:tRNA pseudouridine(13) synthase TruD [Halomonas halocynthiae]|uniref:tRNA pseudouridine(13) synthase TruD n=1 Tax=Halomonas halocynthiae TaxID=176290 RepID=UPI000424C2F5|nr:tRNA pseudouridine(13) synthase TruD [Halomonas halocynthiae]
MRDVIAWPPAWPSILDAEFGPPPAGEYRMMPEDFCVEEVLGFAPEGEGEHLWLWIEKRELTTAMVARELATICEVSLRDIGYAGMKDRVAVTRQWFSVHLPGREAPKELAERLAPLAVKLLEQCRHPRKLKRGVHRGNRFQLRISGDAVTDKQLERRWQRLLSQGVANYFGPQRFGPHGRNLQRAISVLERGWRKRDDRDGMLLSAARSYLFNQQLAARIDAGTWNTPLPGDVMMLDGTESVFVVAADTAPDELGQLAERAVRQDVHPTGVLWGVGQSKAQATPAADEKRLGECCPRLCEGLVAAGVKLSRRSLRVRLDEARLTHAVDGCWLSFTLPKGAFATSVLRELMTHPNLGQPPERVRSTQAEGSRYPEHSST